MRHVIIERPDLQSPLRRAGGRGIGFAFWVLWIYLWTPLISLLAWLLGVALFHDNILDNGAYRLLITNLGWFIPVVLVSAVTLIAWSRYNLLRFRGRELRKNPMPIDIETHARDFNIEVMHLRQWQANKYLVIHHDNNGHIVRIDTARPATTAPGTAQPAPREARQIDEGIRANDR